MGYSSRPLSTNSLFELVNLATHGFHIGQTLIYNGAWTLAKADSLAHCAGTWMVVLVPDVNSFYVAQTGYVSNLTTTYVDTGVITTGIQYYLSPTNAGNLTATMPSSAGSVILPCMIFDTSTTGYFYGGSGILVEPGSLFAWNVATVNTVMSVNNGYVINGAGTLTMTLPPTSTVGDIVEVAGFGSNGWVIAQNAGQVIHFGNMSTTVGVGGSLASTVRYDSIKLLSVTASPNAEWLVLTADGNITIV